MLIKKILKIERRRRNFLQILENREEKEKWVSNREENFFQVLKIERRKRNFSSKVVKSERRMRHEILLLKIEKEKSRFRTDEQMSRLAD